MLRFYSRIQCAGILRRADAVYWTISSHHEREMRHRCARCTMNFQPSTTNAGGAVSVNKCSPAVLHANRLQVLGVPGAQQAGMA